MADITTQAGRQAAADDMISRLKQLIQATDDPKIRKQAEKALKETELLREHL